MKQALHRPELLAPAGDMDCLRAALQYGADAVYLGGQSFTMRAGARNFSPQELKEACTLAHSRGSAVHYTCNALLRNDEVPQLESTLREVRDAGVDALIVADMGVLMTARRVVPEVEVHVSTQVGVTNYLTANELHRLGASRVVLARELTLEDIRGIRENTPDSLDLETFVHGAMCVSFSGRCLLSQYFTGRDANRGDCAQSCRWQYHLVEEKRPGQYYPIGEDEGGSYILNAKDLCTIDFLDQIIAAGVTSLKIEGRAKTPYYVAAITGAYRQALDLWAQNPGEYHCPPWLLEEVTKVSHREYSPGFFFGPPAGGQRTRDSRCLRTWDVVAVVEGYDPATRRLLCRQRNKFQVGDRLEVLLPGVPPRPLTVEALFDAQGSPIPSTPHATMAFHLPYPQALPPGAMLRQQR